MILNLIFGLFITILLTIIYVIASVLGCTEDMFGKKSGSGDSRNRNRGRAHNVAGGGSTNHHTKHPNHHRTTHTGGDMNSALDFMGGILNDDVSTIARSVDGGVFGDESTEIQSADTQSEGTQGADTRHSMDIGAHESEYGLHLTEGGAVPHQYQRVSREELAKNPPDFPIEDPDLKAAFTAAFLEVYGTEEKPPVVTYDNIKSSLKYIEAQKIYTAAYHIGQRKLILNEIQFLTRIPTDEISLIVYAGAAPSNKGALLASLFPNLKLLLIDPAKFEIRPYRNVVVTHLNVTDETDPVQTVDEAFDAFKTADICTARVLMSGGIAAELGRRFAKSGSGKKSDAKSIRSNPFSKLYFVSDIRTNIDDEGPSTFDIIWNSAQHVEWVTKMAPAESMLKFRSPFFNETDSELNAFEELSLKPPFAEAFDATAHLHNYRDFSSRKFTFFDGEIYIQPWSPISSTETRLVFKGVPGLREYVLSEYEDRFFYFNKILRNYQLYKNPNADRKLGFDHCADCALENLIWTDYCKSRGVTNIREEVLHYVKTLCDLTFRPLLHDNHGRAFGPIPINVLMHKFTHYQPRIKKKFVRSGSTKLCTHVGAEDTDGTRIHDIDDSE